MNEAAICIHSTQITPSQQIFNDTSFTRYPLLMEIILTLTSNSPMSKRPV